jgi:hypothetical protein
MESPYYNEQVVNTLVGRVFNIDDITQGTVQQNFILRYRGHIRDQDTAAVYDTLTTQLKPYGLTPLFRWDGDRHAIVLIKGLPVPRAFQSMGQCCFRYPDDSKRDCYRRGLFSASAAPIQSFAGGPGDSAKWLAVCSQYYGYFGRA